MLQLLKIISRGTVQVLLIIHAPPGLGQEKLSKEAGDKKDDGFGYQLKTSPPLAQWIHTIPGVVICKTNIDLLRFSLMS